MQRKSDENLTRVYNALANPYTRRIIQILRENGRAGFKELHDSLRISVGALHNQLDTLEGLVTLGADKMYSLTDQGRTIIDALSVRTSRELAIPPRIPYTNHVLDLSSASFFSAEHSLTI